MGADKGQSTDQASSFQGVLTLHGALTIQRITELKEAVLKSLNSHSHLEIKLEDVRQVDLSFLQLLCSAHKTALSLGKDFTLSSPRPDLFQKTVHDAGFTRRVGCHQDPCKYCLWKEGV